MKDVESTERVPHKRQYFMPVLSKANLASPQGLPHLMWNHIH